MPASQAFAHLHSLTCVTRTLELDTSNLESRFSADKQESGVKLGDEVHREDYKDRCKHGQHSTGHESCWTHEVLGQDTR